MASNNLSGQLPAQLGNCSNLALLDLSHNFFTGLTPSFTNGKMQNLENLYLSHNSLQGSLTAMLSSSLFNFNSSCQLRFLDVSNNFLKGHIPADLLHNCESLSVLKLSSNHLEGVVPHELLQNSSFPNLDSLSLGNNRLIGALPTPLKSNHQELVLLDLSHNYLEGNIQEILFRNSSDRMERLRVLLLGFNSFSGSIPMSLGKYTPALQVIDISNNLLTGHIPPALQDLDGFRVMTRDFLASSMILTTLFDQEIEVQVKGSIAQYTYVLLVMILLDVSGNNLSGPIPMGLGSLSGMVSLNMSRNRLCGPIPQDLGQLKGLQSLDLSFNELDGSIPESFINLHALEVFNVSFNKGLKGPIPDQPQFNEIEQSYLGDPQLCGKPTPRSCAVVAHVMSPPDIPREDFPSSIKSFIDEWISIPGLCLGFSVGFGGALWVMEITNRPPLLLLTLQGVMRRWRGV